MALIGQIAIGMVVKTQRFEAGLNSAASSLRSFGGQVGDVATGAVGVLGKGLSMIGDVIGSVIGAVAELANKLLLVGGALVTGAGFALWSMAQSAMAFGEQTDRARVVFGTFADSVIKQAELMSTAFGVSAKQFIQTASALGSIFKGAGYSQEDSAALSIHFTKLATDLASLVHIPVEEAMGKIESGLVGMSRPLREVGVFMNEEAVASEAARLGIARLGTELTESQKMQARVSLMTKSLADAHGNLALTAGSSANQVKGLQGRIESLWTAIGTSLLPIVAKALDGLQVGIEALKIAWEKSGLAANAASVGVVGGAAKQVGAMSWVQQAVVWAADQWDVMKVKGLEMFFTLTNAAMKFLMSLQDFAVQIAPFFGIASREMQKSFDGAIQSTMTLQRELNKLIDIEKKKPPTHNAVNELFGDAQKRIQAARDELANTPDLDAAGLTPKKKEEDKPSPIRFATAQSMYSKEAANTQLRSTYGQTPTGKPGEKAAQETVKNTATTVTLLEKILNKIGTTVGEKAADLINI